MRIRIKTEKPGWIMHREAVEIAKYVPNVLVNESLPDADLHYFINYGYFDRPTSGLAVGNFTHYDPERLADVFVSVAHSVDHCVAVSRATAEVMVGLGIPQEKITVIMHGPDIEFRPQLILGIGGKVQKGTRKGQHLVAALQDDQELMRDVRLVATHDSWGIEVWPLERRAFYQAIDYLLVPSLIEGGPVPFMEALACGTASIAPPIGVIPDFYHLEYPVGDIEALKRKIRGLRDQKLERAARVNSEVVRYDWYRWAKEHERLFQMLIHGERPPAEFEPFV